MGPYFCREMDLSYNMVHFGGLFVNLITFFGHLGLKKQVRMILQTVS